MITYKYSLHLATALVILLVSVLVLSGCLKGVGPYKSFELNKGIGHFSLEYPSYWDTPRVTTNTKSDYKYTWVNFDGPFEGYGLRPRMEVDVWSTSSNISDSLAAWEDDYDHYQSFSNFEMIDSSPIEIDSIQGNKYTFSYTSIADERTNDREPADVIEIRVYFDYGGFIWIIELWAPVPNIEVNQRTLSTC